MRRKLLFWCALTLFPVLHFLFQVGFGFGTLAPNLLVLSLLLAAREMRASRAAALGFVFGLLEDAFSILAFGANTVALVIVGIAGSRTRDLFVGESASFFFGYLFLGSWLSTALHWLVAGEAVRGGAMRILVVEGISGGLYVAVVGVALLSATGTLAKESG